MNITGTKFKIQHSEKIRLFCLHCQEQITLDLEVFHTTNDAKIECYKCSKSYQVLGITGTKNKIKFLIKNDNFSQ